MSARVQEVARTLAMYSAVAEAVLARGNLYLIDVHPVSVRRRVAPEPELRIQAKAVCGAVDHMTTQGSLLDSTDPCERVPRLGVSGIGLELDPNAAECLERVGEQDPLAFGIDLTALVVPCHPGRSNLESTVFVGNLPEPSHADESLAASVLNREAEATAVSPSGNAVFNELPQILRGLDAHRHVPPDVTFDALCEQ